MLRKNPSRPPPRKIDCLAMSASVSSNDEFSQIFGKTLHNEIVKHSNAATSEKSSDTISAISAQVTAQNSAASVGMFQNFTSPEAANSPKIYAAEPLESASVQGSRQSGPKLGPTVKPVKFSTDSDSESTYCSENVLEYPFSSPKSLEGPESLVVRKKPQGGRSRAESGRKRLPRRKKLSARRKRAEVAKRKMAFLEELETSSNSNVSVIVEEPPEHLTHKERLQWLQDRRGNNLWVQCEKCKKWRQLDVQDPVDIPKVWYCEMNSDTKKNDCSVPEDTLSVNAEMNMIYNEYTAGSLVWAKLTGYPWWPAMVDDCPDTEQYFWLNGYSEVPTSYNVTFFDSEEVTRQWIRPRWLISFKHNPDYNKRKISPRIYRDRIEFAKSQIKDAVTLNIKARLKKYSFINRWSHEIKPPLSIKEIQKQWKSLEAKRTTRRRLIYESSSEGTFESSEDILILPKTGNKPVVQNPCSYSSSSGYKSGKKRQHKTGTESDSDFPYQSIQEFEGKPKKNTRDLIKGNGQGKATRKERVKKRSRKEKKEQHTARKSPKEKRLLEDGPNFEPLPNMNQKKRKMIAGRKDTTGEKLAQLKRAEKATLKWWEETTQEIKASEASNDETEQTRLLATRQVAEIKREITAEKFAINTGRIRVQRDSLKGTKGAGIKKRRATISGPILQEAHKRFKKFTTSDKTAEIQQICKEREIKRTLLEAQTKNRLHTKTLKKIQHIKEPLGEKIPKDIQGISQSKERLIENNSKGLRGISQSEESLIKGIEELKIAQIRNTNFCENSSEEETVSNEPNLNYLEENSDSSPIRLVIEEEKSDNETVEFAESQPKIVEKAELNWWEEMTQKTDIYIGASNSETEGLTKFLANEEESATMKRGRTAEKFAENTGRIKVRKDSLKGTKGREIKQRASISGPNIQGALKTGQIKFKKFTTSDKTAETNEIGKEKGIEHTLLEERIENRPDTNLQRIQQNEEPLGEKNLKGIGEINQSDESVIKGGEELKVAQVNSRNLGENSSEEETVANESNVNYLEESSDSSPIRLVIEEEQSDNETVDFEESQPKMAEKAELNWWEKMTQQIDMYAGTSDSETKLTRFLDTEQESAALKRGRIAEDFSENMGRNRVRRDSFKETKGAVIKQRRATISGPNLQEALKTGLIKCRKFTTSDKTAEAEEIGKERVIKRTLLEERTEKRHGTKTPKKIQHFEEPFGAKNPEDLQEITQSKERSIKGTEELEITQVSSRNLSETSSEEETVSNEPFQYFLEESSDSSPTRLVIEESDNETVDLEKSQKIFFEELEIRVQQLQEEEQLIQNQTVLEQKFPLNNNTIENQSNNLYKSQTFCPELIFTQNFEPSEENLINFDEIEVAEEVEVVETSYLDISGDKNIFYSDEIYYSPFGLEISGLED